MPQMWQKTKFQIAGQIVILPNNPELPSCSGDKWFKSSTRFLYIYLA